MSGFVGDVSGALLLYFIALAAQVAVVWVSYDAGKRRQARRNVELVVTRARAEVGERTVDLSKVPVQRDGRR